MIDKFSLHMSYAEMTRLKQARKQEIVETLAKWSAEDIAKPNSKIDTFMKKREATTEGSDSDKNFSEKKARTD